MPDIFTATVSYRDFVRSGRSRVLLRINPQDLARVDRAATILRISREQFVRNTVLCVAEHIIEIDAASRPADVVGSEEPVSRSSSVRSFDPSKPPGM